MSEDVGQASQSWLGQDRKQLHPGFELHGKLWKHIFKGDCNFFIGESVTKLIESLQYELILIDWFPLSDADNLPTINSNSKR